MFKLRNNRGLTLMELITAVGVSGLILLVVATLSMYIYVQFENTKEQLKAETSANRLEYLFRLYLSQAVNISGTSGLTQASGANYALTDINGQGHWFGSPNQSYTWDEMGDLTGDWVTLGVFVRETGMGTDSDLQPAAIWYRKPSPTTSGVVFFDSGENSANMAPDYSDPYVSGLTQFEFQRRDIAGQLSSIRINYRIRYQRQMGNKVVNWCPGADIMNGVPGCATTDQLFRRIDKNFEVILRNNFRSSVGINGTPGDVYTLGRLYFFQIANPARWVQ